MVKKHQPSNETCVDRSKTEVEAGTFYSRFAKANQA
jgi:hypothetical protein